MTAPATDEDFARAFAPLLEVQQGGTFRPATPSDVLEILEAGGGRHVLKGRRGYLAGGGKGWSRRQREALVAPDRETAQSLQRMVLRDYGVKVKVLRVRRKGTCGVVAVRMREGLAVKRYEDGAVGIDVGNDEAMRMLAALTAAKRAEGEQ